MSLTTASTLASGRDKAIHNNPRDGKTSPELTVALYKKATAHTHTHTHLTALLPGRPGWAGTRKVKPIWISLKQQTVSGSGISWAICKSAPCSRQITTPAPHHSVFYKPDALPAGQPTASKHWRPRKQLQQSDITWYTGLLTKTPAVCHLPPF